MKKLIALLLALVLLPVAAVAEFDRQRLRETEGYLVSVEPKTWDAVVSPMNQPYMGELDDGTLLVCVDYIEKVDLDVTLVRVLVSLMIYEHTGADTVVFEVGGKRYAFEMQPQVYEYDGLVMEDYAICLTDAGLPFLKALAQQKQDEPIPVSFVSGGEVRLTGRVILPGEEMAQIYDYYIDLGGRTQNLKSLDERWPVKITKTK